MFEKTMIIVYNIRDMKKRNNVYKVRWVNSINFDILIFYLIYFGVVILGGYLVYRLLLK